MWKKDLELKGKTTLEVSFGDEFALTEFQVIKDLGEQVIFGRDFMRKMRVAVEYGENEVEVKIAGKKINEFWGSKN